MIGKPRTTARKKFDLQTRWRQPFPDSRGGGLTVEGFERYHGNYYCNDIKQPGEDPQSPPDPFGVIKRCDSQNNDR